MSKIFLFLFLITTFAFSETTIYEDMSIEGKLSTQALDVTDSSNPCPRKTNAQMRAIASPKNGQCVYNTDESSPYFYSSVDVDWMQAAGSGASSDELLKNNSFEASDAVKNWTVTTLATATKTPSTFDGKQKVCLTGAGSIYQMLTDTDKFHGRKFIARMNVERTNSNAGKVCLYDGEELSQCVDTVQDTVFREYAIQGTFITGKTYGLIYTSTSLNGSCVDKASFKLNANEAYEAQIEGDYQSEVLGGVTNLTETTNLASATVIKTSSNSVIYTKSSQGITFLRNANVKVSYFNYSGAGVNVFARIFLNGQLTTGQGTGNAFELTAPLALDVVAGDKITFSGTGGSGTSSRLVISASARSKVIVHPDETFDSSINNLKWSATECSANDIGCYNTYRYVASTNTPLLCDGTSGNGRPTQTDAEMKAQGLRIWARNYTVTGTCAQPTYYAVVIGDDTRPWLGLFKDASRTISGTTVASLIAGGGQLGIPIVSYNPFSAKYHINAGRVLDGNVSGATFLFSDSSTQSNGYLHIKANKTGLGISNKPARQPVYVSPPDAPNDITIYNDGYCEQAVKSSSFNVAANYVANPSINLPVAMKDTSYLSVFDLYGSGASYFVYLEARADSLKTTTAVSPTVRNQTSTAYTGGFVSALVKGYCAASALLPYGIKVNY